jgi:large subunit ribosomal protein L17
MLRNLATALLRHRRITTTATRAKEVSRFASSLITLARKAHSAATVHQKLACKRRVFQDLSDRDVAQELFDVIAPALASREASQKQGGGYTRIVPLGYRKGDGAPMVLVEILES